MMNFTYFGARLGVLAVTEKLLSTSQEPPCAFRLSMRAFAASRARGRGPTRPSVSTVSSHGQRQPCVTAAYDCTLQDLATLLGVGSPFLTFPPTSRTGRVPLGWGVETGPPVPPSCHLLPLLLTVPQSSFSVTQTTPRWVTCSRHPVIPRELPHHRRNVPLSTPSCFQKVLLHLSDWQMSTHPSRPKDASSTGMASPAAPGETEAPLGWPFPSLCPPWVPR